MLYLVPIIIGISLGLLGGGGTILAVPALIYIFGLAAKEAIVISLLVVGASSLITTLANLYKKKIEFYSILLFGSFSMFASYLSSHYLATLISGKTQLIIFIFLSTTVAIQMLKAKQEVGKIGLSKTEKITLIIILALLLGLTTGIVGVGGGFLIVPTLIIFLDLEMDKAVASSLLIIAMQALTAFWGSMGTVTIDYSFAIPFTIMISLGSLIGSFFSSKVNQILLKKIFAWLLLIVSLGMIISLALSS